MTNEVPEKMKLRPQLPTWPVPGASSFKLMDARFEYVSDTTRFSCASVSCAESNGLSLPSPYWLDMNVVF